MDSVLNHFGKTLSVEEVASYLHLSEKTVCRNFELLGGIRLSPRGKIIFFEKPLIHAINQRVKNKSLLSFFSENEIIEDRHNILV